MIIPELESFQAHFNEIKKDEKLNAYRNSFGLEKITEEEILKVVIDIDKICTNKIIGDILTAEDGGFKNKTEYFLGALFLNFCIRKLECKNNETCTFPNDDKYKDKIIKKNMKKILDQLDYHNEYTIFRKYGWSSFFNILCIILSQTLSILENINRECYREKQLVNNYIYNLFCFMNENELFIDKNNYRVNSLRAYYFYPSETIKKEFELISLVDVNDLKLNKFEEIKNIYNAEKRTNDINIQINNINRELKNIKHASENTEILIEIGIVIKKLSIIIKNIDLHKLGKFYGSGKIYTRAKEVYLYLLANLEKKHFDVRNYELEGIFGNELIEETKISALNIEKTYDLCKGLIEYEKFENKVEAIYQFEESFRFFYLINGYQLLLNDVFKNNKKLFNKAVELFEAMLVMPNCFTNIIFLKYLMNEIIHTENIDSNRVEDIITNVKLLNDVIIPYYNNLFHTSLKFVFESKEKDIINNNLYEYAMNSFHRKEYDINPDFNKKQKYDKDLFAMLASIINKKLCIDNTKTNNERFLNLVHGYNYKYLINHSAKNPLEDMITLGANEADETELSVREKWLLNME